jgi:hypothetical protein
MRRLLLLSPALWLAPLLGGCGPQGLASNEPTTLAITSAGEGKVEVRLRGPGAQALKSHLHAADATAVEPWLRLEMTSTTGKPAALLARVDTSGEEIRLTPQAPLTPGVSYHAIFQGSTLGPGFSDLTQDYQITPEASASQARVTEVFPHGQVLPANVFRFYVTFSAPMAEGQVFRYVRLLNEKGEPLRQAFHEVELWAEDHRRLTLWISPGRTKEALGISEKMGAVLQPGHGYTLVVGAGLPDRLGKPLARDFRLAFRTGDPDHLQPDINRWKLSPPPAGTRKPLRVTFDEALDRPLLREALTVRNADEAPVKGMAQPAPDGGGWVFTPTDPWPQRELSLAAAGDLDDLAGNSLYRRFETASEARRTPVVEAPVYRRTFSPVTDR